MNFNLSEEEEAVKQLTGQILGESTSFEQTRAVELDDEGPGFDQALWAQLAESNLIGLSLPEASGGQGFSFLALCLMLEEAGRNLSPVPLLESIVYTALPIQRFGQDNLEKDLITRVIAGEILLTAALFEVGAPMSSRTMKTKATAADQGAYTLTGEKICVPFAAAAGQDPGRRLER